MRRFEIVDGEKPRAQPCAILEVDQKKGSFSVRLAEGAGSSDVPLAFAPFAERGERDVPQRWVESWIAERIAPPSRQNIGEVLRAHGLEEYDACELLASGEGRSTQDGFYVREVTGGYKGSAVLGREIERRREALGMTQEQLARRSGMRQETISRIECGRANPTAGTLDALARALGARLEIRLV